MYKLLFPLLLLILFVKINGQSEIPDLIRKGQEYSLDFQVNKAEEIFNTIISKYPSDPRGYHYKSNIYLWLYLSNKKQKDYDNFIKYSDLCISKSEVILDDHDNDLNALYTLGANYGLRAMAFMKANNNFNAIWGVKNANKYLKKTLEINPSYYDAYLGLGLFNYALSFVPGVIKWTLKLAGISGDRNEGVKYLNLAFAKGKYTKSEAAYYLSQIYSETIIDYDKSSGYLKVLVKKYPRNCLFRYSYAVVLIKQKYPDKAKDILTDLIKENNTQFSQTLAYANFSLGDIYFHANDFAKALQYYNKFFSISSETDYSGIVYFRIALCNEFLGNRAEAQKNYILARNGNLDLADDAYAKRMSEKYFSTPPSESQKEIIKAANLIENGNYNETIDRINNLLPQLNSPVLRSEAYLYLSDAHYYLMKYRESNDYAERALKLKVNAENWIHAFATYYIARNYFNMNNKELTKEYLDKAEDYGDYDYQQKLASLLSTLRLKSEKS